MPKLYRFTQSGKEYWEAWEDKPGSHIVHWGVLGTEGESKTVTSTFTRTAETSIQNEMDDLVAQGFAPVDLEDHATMMIEYAIDGFGSEADLGKRERLEDRLNEALGWTGLGACDGGSIGSGTMEACSFVVDFALAKRVIQKNLDGTEFGDYTRIYDETADD